jgi:hypothetical protein
MRMKQHHRALRHRSGRTERAATSSATQPAKVLDRVLALPLVDRVLNQLLGRPRVLQGIGLVLGLAVVALALRPLLGSSSVAVVPVAVPVAQPAVIADHDAVLSVVAAYNQASIAAAVLGRADSMAAYLAVDGATWSLVQAEYARRATRGETHEPALTRWGVLRLAVEGNSATVETQEQWDDMTSIGGQVISSRRGILTRNTYTLRRAPDPTRWLITDVATTTIIN